MNGKHSNGEIHKDIKILLAKKIGQDAAKTAKVSKTEEKNLYKIFLKDKSSKRIIGKGFLIIKEKEGYKEIDYLNLS